jgi:hypothetical protein
MECPHPRFLWGSSHPAHLKLSPNILIENTNGNSESYLLAQWGQHLCGGNLRFATVIPLFTIVFCNCVSSRHECIFRKRRPPFRSSADYFLERRKSLVLHSTGAIHNESSMESNDHDMLIFAVRLHFGYELSERTEPNRCFPCETKACACAHADVVREEPSVTREAHMCPIS